MVSGAHKLRPGEHEPGTCQWLAGGLGWQQAPAGGRLGGCEMTSCTVADRSKAYWQAFRFWEAAWHLGVGLAAGWKPGVQCQSPCNRIGGLPLDTPSSTYGVLRLQNFTNSTLTPILLRCLLELYNT